MLIRHMGEWIEADRLIRHYRFMSHFNARSAAFWRQRVRVVIEEVRAAREWRAAA